MTAIPWALCNASEKLEYSCELKPKICIWNKRKQTSVLSSSVFIQSSLYCFGAHRILRCHVSCLLSLVSCLLPLALVCVCVCVSVSLSPFAPVILFYGIRWLFAPHFRFARDSAPLSLFTRRPNIMIALASRYSISFLPCPPATAPLT